MAASGAAAPGVRGTRQLPKQLSHTEKASPEIVVRVTPRLSEAPQPGEFLTAGVGRLEMSTRVAAVLAEHINMTSNGSEYVPVFIGLRYKPNVKCSQRGDVPSCFKVQVSPWTRFAGHM
jgi:hypothetical protein